MSFFSATSPNTR
ncbi:hypothetical protein OXX79_014483, partial [Metschnikowia pulcherrima]